MTVASPRRKIRPPYIVSPTIGWPIAAMWTRNWCVRPVLGVSFTKREPRRRRRAVLRSDRELALLQRLAEAEASNISSTSYLVTAGSAAVLFLADGLLLADVTVLADRHVDHVRQQLRHAVDDGHVGLLDRAVLELPGDAPMGLVALGDEHDAGGVAVEAVQDARPPVAVDRAPLLPVVDQPVDQRAGPPAAGGVDHQVGLLVQGQQVIVFVDDLQRDRLGHDLVDRLRRGDHLHLVAFAWDGSWP